MKKNFTAKRALTGLLALTLVLLLAGCGGNTAPSPSAAGTASSAAASPASLQTLDFATVMTSFAKDQTKSNDWDRTNIVKADTTTTATIAVPHGQTKPVVMLKGDPGKLDATSATAGTLTTDPTKNSYFASALLLKNGSVAQYGDGIYKFKISLTGPQAGTWNNAVVFKDSSPQTALSEDSVSRALAIVTVDGVVQIQKNYKNTSGKVVKQEVVKDTGVNIGDGKYHYFILAMQDIASGTNVKLWIDGTAAYTGVVTGVAGTGAIQLMNNSTPVLNKDGTPLITAGTQAGTYQPVTACMESYVGGYDDGPDVSNIALDPAK